MKNSTPAFKASKTIAFFLPNFNAFSKSSWNQAKMIGLQCTNSIKYSFLLYFSSLFCPPQGKWTVFVLRYSLFRPNKEDGNFVVEALIGNKDWNLLVPFLSFILLVGTWEMYGGSQERNLSGTCQTES